MLWSRSLTNLLFFSFSVLFIIILSEWTAGDRLPPRVSGWILLAGCLGLTGEGVARSLGTAGGGTTSTTCPARSAGLTAPRGRGSEEGRGALVVRGISSPSPRASENHLTAPSVGWLHISLTFSRANIRAQVKYFYTRFFSNPQSDLNRSQAGQSSEC